MPTYEYRCTACGRRLEVVQKFSDEPLTECPECFGDLRRVFGSVGVVLKGSGFYRTDNRRGGSDGGAGANGKSSESKSSESKSSESKSSESKSSSSSSSSSPSTSSSPAAKSA
jgi:putative FmdB family regulatory protein